MVTPTLFGFQSLSAERRMDPMVYSKYTASVLSTFTLGLIPVLVLPSNSLMGRVGPRDM